MTKTLIYFYILFEIIHSLNGESSKGSLTFVIDDTYSMSDEIAQVKEKTNQLFDAVLNSNATKVDDFVLVTFNDPGTELRTITRKRREFKRALAAITVNGGDDCPEYAMSGIELALEKSKPNSLFYVYTDAAAKDYARFDRVKSLSLKKSTKVTFLLTGECPGYDAGGFLVYDKLAAATSGQVFHIGKHDINKIIDYIIESVKHVKTTLVQKLFEGSGKTIQFNVDSKSWDIIVSVSASNPNFRVIGPDGRTVGMETEKSRITKTSRIETLKVNPGLHTISFDTVGPTSVVITASTSVTFEHGFSTIPPESLNETATKPFPGDKSYLAISLDNYKKDVKLINIEIRDPDDKVINTLPLKLINKDTQFYVTEAFLPPSKTFKLAVIGYTKTGEKIVRLGSTTIEPQDDKSEKTILNKKPTVTIIGEPKRVVEYNEPLTIKCKVHAYPKPNVIWQDSTGTTLPSILTTVDLPYDYISTTNLSNVKKNTTLTCKAINIKGDSEASVNVKLKTFLQVLEQPEDTTINYGESFTFKINVSASPPPSIVWFKKSAVITSNDNYEFSSDNSSLILKHSNNHVKGVYEIQVSNGYQDEIIIFKVSIYAEWPKIDESNRYLSYIEGSTVTIKCNVTRGFPKPKIFWSYMPDESGESFDLDEKSDTLRLENVKSKNTGTYKCTAVNEVGKNDHEIILFIEYPPSIINGKDEKIKTLKGKKVVLHCATKGKPDPSIKWFKNNVEISNSATYRIRNEHLRFTATSFGDTGNYTCEATNSLGTAKKNFEINVYEKAYITPPKETNLTLNVGSLLSLSCEAHGYPKPEVRWAVYEFTSKVTPKTLRGDEKNTVTIPRIQIEDQGLYVCMANNTEETAYLTYEVHISARPSIINTLKDKTLIGVVGDLLLRIPCKAVGSPKPTITWMVDEDYLAVGTHAYDVEEDGTLLIKNLTEKSAGTYKCKAENSAGTAFEIFDVKIQENPYPDKPTENILIEQGQSANIKCDLPHKAGDLVRWYKDGKIVATNELQLKNVLIENSGIYTCRVSDFMYSYSSHKMITVGYKPKFNNEEDTNIEFSEGAIALLGCNASSYPPPDVEWYHNGLQIEETSMELFLEMNNSDIGNFTCIISNAFGEITRTFNITTSKECILNIENDFDGQQPLILTYRNQWHVLKNTKGSVIIPRMHHIRLVCPESYVTDKTSRFTESVTAKCLENSKFKIQEKIVDFKDLKCYKEIKPLAKLLHENCGLEINNTKLLTVGFNIRTEFLSVYDVCIDKDQKVPIYAKYTLDSSSASVIPKALINTTFRESKHLPYQFDHMYNCRNQLLNSFVIRTLDDTMSCCFTKRQLVNPKDVLPGLAQKATYNYLNVVPHWSTCGTENWDEVEYRVRQLVKNLNIRLDVWTGSSKLKGEVDTDTYLIDNYSNSQPVSPYIWKVLHNPESDEALAIIQLNIRDLMISDAVKNVPCRDICNEIEWMKGSNWYDTSKGFTICCSLEDFENVFGYIDPYISGPRILAQNFLPKFALA